MGECDYQPEWAALPEFSNWLRPDPASSRHALCCLCDIQLKASITHLRRHARVTHPEFAPRTKWPRATQRLRYNPEWQKLPELTDWLRRSPHNPDFAFCRPCNKELSPMLHYLRQHAVSSLHQRRSRRPAAAQSGPSESLPDSLDAPDAAAVDAFNGTEDSGNRKKRRRAETIEMWQQRPEFASWLRRSASDRTQAFCLVCYKEFTAKLVFVRRHAATTLHRRRAALSEGAAETEEYQPVLEPRAEGASSPSPPASPRPAGDGDARDADGDGGGGGGDGDAAEGGGGGGGPKPAGADNAVYNPAWERRPELAGWISRGPDQPRRAYCRVCRIEITPKLAHVRRHGASQRHIRNAQEAGEEVVLASDTHECAGEPGLENSGDSRVFVVAAGYDAGTSALEDGANEEGTAASATNENWTIVDEQHESNPDDPDYETPHQTQDEHDPDIPPPKPSFPRRSLPYQTLWEKLPELRDWLTRSPWDERRPFCRWCRREVTPKLAHLRRHAMSGIHRRARPTRMGGKEGGQGRSRGREEAAQEVDAGPEMAGDDRAGGQVADDSVGRLWCLICS